MSTVAQVVDGEASESDSEVELGKSVNSSMVSSSVTKDFVIPGEAPESDDECKLPNRTTSMDSVVSDETVSAPSTPSRVSHPSLLHQKLWECNVSLRATVECLLRHTTDLAVEKLTRSDKTLLNAQESMRAANANITLARVRMKQIQAGLEKAGCATALPNVRVG